MPKTREERRDSTSQMQLSEQDSGKPKQMCMVNSYQTQGQSRDTQYLLTQFQSSGGSKEQLLYGSVPKVSFPECLDTVGCEPCNITRCLLL